MTPTKKNWMRFSMSNISILKDPDALSPRSSNLLEQLWTRTAEEFTRRVGVDGIKAYKSAREETMSATKEIGKVESAIDNERVKSLYGI